MDEYAWMRDPDWQAVMRDPSRLRPDIRAHLEAENAYAEAVMAPAADLVRTLFGEMKGRIKEDDDSVPAPDGPWEYFTHYREGGQYPVYARRPRGGGEAQTLLDGDAEAVGNAYFDLGDAEHSPDHRYLAWAVDVRGSEYFEIRVRDLQTGADIETVAPESAGDFTWAADSRTLFWVWRDDNNRPNRVYRSRVGGGDPALVYEEADPGFFVNVGATDANNYVVINAHGHTTTELRLIDAHAPESAPRLVAPRREGVEYDLIEADDRFYVHTNDGGAVDFKVAETPKDRLETENWRDVIPHRPGVLIICVLGFKHWLVRLERENALPRIVIREYATGAEHSIDFPDEAYALGVDAGFEYDTATLRLAYESPSRPEEVYDYDMAARTRVLRKRQEIPSGHDPDAYVVRRLLAETGDGETVPVTILHRRDARLDGTAPLLLYGYGAYGHAIPAGFRIKPLSLVDRGMMFAVAHVRGGTDKGYGWYLDGRLEKKPNTFADFIAAARALIAAGYTAEGRIVAMGGSAGGLLVGASVNLAPELFAGAVAQVPFVDVVNTMCDPDLPLTPPEWPEWGNPLESEAAYDTIAAYSPYDNVRAAPYPAILITAGLTDPRVTYWEPAKWAARLRARRADAGITLLKTEMEAGHGGKTGRFDALKDDAFEYAFALHAVGIEQ
jgi:oligopeptidase B